MPEVTISITMDENGAININGPLPNRVMLYGMIMTAMDMVQKWNDQQENRVQPASIIPPVKFPGS